MAAEITVESDMDDNGERSGIAFPSMNKVYRGGREDVGRQHRRSFASCSITRKTTKKGMNLPRKTLAAGGIELEGSPIERLAEDAATMQQLQFCGT